MRRIIRTIFIIIVLLTSFSLSGCNKDEDMFENLDNISSATITIKQAGTLSSHISEESAPQVLNLTIKGHMDVRDFRYISRYFSNLNEIDLTKIVIDEYKDEEEKITYKKDHIPSSAFKCDVIIYGMRSLKKVILPTGIKEIGFGAFREASSLTQINIPEGVEVIGNSAFKGCVSLIAVNLHEGINIIHSEAFLGCTSLKDIYLPEGIKEIGSNAFDGCTSLKDIYLPEGIKHIGSNAFDGCTSLKEIKLPSTLSKIGSDVFKGMANLRDVTVAAFMPPKASIDTFRGIPENATLYVPKGAKTLYEEAPGWNVFNKIIEK